MNINNQELNQQVCPEDENKDNKESENKNTKVRSLLELALETLYQIDTQVEEIKHEIPKHLLKAYEKYVANREKLKEEKIKKEQKEKICQKIGDDLALIGDEFMKIIHDRKKGINYRQLVRIAGTLIHVSCIFMDSVNDNLML